MLIGTGLMIDFALGIKFLIANLHSGSIKNKIMMTPSYVSVECTLTIKVMIESASTKVELPDSPVF